MQVVEDAYKLMGLRTLFVSIEMPVQDVCDRWHSIRYYEANGFSDDKRDQWEKEIDAMHGRDDAEAMGGNVIPEGVDICEDADTVQKIETILRRAQRDKNPYHIVVVDYIQLMRGNPHAKSKEEEVGGIAKDLKRMAKRRSALIIPLSQLNRTAGDGHEKPNLAQLRDSGQVEEAADAVIMLWCPEDGKIGVFDPKNRPSGNHKPTFLEQHGTYFKDCHSFEFPSDENKKPRRYYGESRTGNFEKE
jgi:hypothetical protein